MFNFTRKTFIVLMVAASLWAWIYFDMIAKYPLLSVDVMILAIITFVFVTRGDDNASNL